MNPGHRPDPEFVGRLEREVAAAARRKDRFANGAARGMVSQRTLRLSVAAAAVCALFIGSAATFAVSRGLRAKSADLIIARAEALHDFAVARLELFMEEIADAESAADDDRFPPEHAPYMRLQLFHAQTEVARLALDLEESRLAGREHDNALSTSLVGGRDFVTERLELEQAVIAERYAVLASEVARYEPGSNEALHAQQQQVSMQAELTRIRDRLALRSEFVAGSHTAREVELADMRSTLQRDRDSALRIYDELQRHYVDMEASLATDPRMASDRRAMELELHSAQLQVRLAELELEALDRKLAEAPNDRPAPNR